MLGRDELIAAARKLWGQETEASKHEMRFGRHGSKKIDLDKLTWYDHESAQGGGVKALCIQAGIPGHDVFGDGLSPSEIAYDYYDEEGVQLFQVVRRPGHKFIQRKPVGTGWEYKTKGVRKVLYRLPQLLAADPNALVVVTEGEKDADNVRDRLGLVATTNPGGAGKWRPEYGQSLRGRDVVIIPDNDTAGVEHANKVWRALHRIARSVRILYLPGLIKPDKDISDWIAKGGTREKFLELLQSAPVESPPEPSAWEDALIMPDKLVRPLAIFENTVVMLRHMPQFKDRFAYDEMLRAVITNNSPARPLTDNDVLEVQGVLQRAGLRKIGRLTTGDAISFVAQARSFHPVRDLLDAAADGWDRTPRNADWVCRYLGAEDTPYNRAIGSMFLVALVARIYRPGCQADYMVILEGPQGTFKSSACRILGGQWFSDSLRDITHKDASQHIRGKWLIEMPELAAYSRAEVAAFKDFLTRTVERYRPPYGRFDVIEPRQCLFVGTANVSRYLRDETGGRRFWPLVTGITHSIDLEALARDRLQLLGEAVHEFRNEVPWWPDAEFEAQFIAPEQEKRYEADEWLGPIADYLDNHLLTPTVTMAQIAKEALGLELPRLGPIEQKRIASCLRKLGWEPKVANSRRFWQHT